jgi:branched-chain amino acid transport system substrate-binding protein
MAKNKRHGAMLTRRSLLAGGLALPFIAREHPAAATETFRLGWLPSLTGPLSSAAIGFDHGVRFGVEEVNKAGGIAGRQLELVTRDTGGDPTKAVNLAQQLLFSEKVQFMAGPVNSGESLATVPIVARAGIPNLVTGAVEELIDPVKYPLAYRVVNTTTQWIMTANDYAINQRKLKKVAIIGDTTGYGSASTKRAANMAKTAGADVVYTALADPNKTDLTDEMTKARAAGAQVVMVWTAASGLAARLLNTRGDLVWSVPIVGHPVLGTPAIKPLLNKPDYWADTITIGYRSMSFGPDGKLPERTQKLVDALRPQLGGDVIQFKFWWIALGYDIIRIVDHAVREANGTKPADIKRVLDVTTDFPGVFAEYTWSAQNHNGVPDTSMVANLADSFKDGCYALAPR